MDKFRFEIFLSKERDEDEDLGAPLELICLYDSSLILFYFWRKIGQTQDLHEEWQSASNPTGTLYMQV